MVAFPSKRLILIIIYVLKYYARILPITAVTSNNSVYISKYILFLSATIFFIFSRRSFLNASQLSRMQISCVVEMIIHEFKSIYFTYFPFNLKVSIVIRPI